MRAVLIVAILWTLPVLASSGAAGQPADHPPIRIVADEDFSNPTNGISSGSGTAGDPYIIENWRIARQTLDLGQTQAAIHIENTDAHLILRGIVVDTPFQVGIGVMEARNITIENIVLSGQPNSLALRDVKDIKIRDIDITGAGPSVVAAVLVSQGQRVVLHNVVLLDGEGVGMQIATSKYVSLQGVRVSGHDGGLRVQSSSDIDLVGVQADGNRGDGVWVSNVTRAKLLGLHLSDQQPQGGFGTGRGLVMWDSTGTIEGLDALRNSGRGALIRDSKVDIHNARFLDNGGAGAQFLLADLSISAVEAHHNGGAGLEILAPQEGLPFVRAEAIQVHDNGGAGVYIEGMQGIDLQGIRAQYNRLAGIEIRDSGNLSLLNSHLIDNKASGLQLADVVNGQITNTHAKGNSKDGFALRLSSRLTVDGNVAANNGASGFVLDGKGLTVRNNQATDNGEYGIRILPAARNATLSGNLVSGNEISNDLSQSTPENGVPGLFVLVPLTLALLVRHKRP